MASVKATIIIRSTAKKRRSRKNISLSICIQLYSTHLKTQNSPQKLWRLAMSTIKHTSSVQRKKKSKQNKSNNKQTDTIVDVEKNNNIHVYTDVFFASYTQCPVHPSYSLSFYLSDYLYRNTYNNMYFVCVD